MKINLCLRAGNVLEVSANGTTVETVIVSCSGNNTKSRRPAHICLASAVIQEVRPAPGDKKSHPPGPSSSEPVMHTPSPLWWPNTARHSSARRQKATMSLCMCGATATQRDKRWRLAWWLLAEEELELGLSWVSFPSPKGQSQEVLWLLRHAQVFCRPPTSLLEAPVCLHFSTQNSPLKTFITFVHNQASFKHLLN